MSAAPPGITPFLGVDGIIVGLAVDHRDSFGAALRERGIPDDDAHVRAIKLDVIEALSGDVGMLLLDADTLAWAREDSGTNAVAGSRFAMPLEAQGYGPFHAVERTELLEHPTPSEVAAAGAVAAKLLLPYRPDLVVQAQVQRTVAAAAIAMSHAVGLPLILEPIVWSAPGDQLDPARLAELVVDAARSLAPLAPGLLKLQYPGSRTACDAVHAACGGHPWVLLGGGAPLARLERQLADACAAGAIGCIVGRSLFDGALDADADRRRAWLREVARPALGRLSGIVAAHASHADPGTRT